MRDRTGWLTVGLLLLCCSVAYGGYLGFDQVFSDTLTRFVQGQGVVVTLTDSGTDGTTTLYLPKNATVTSAFMNVSGAGGSQSLEYVSHKGGILDDTYIDSNAPSTNYGTSNSLVVEADYTMSWFEKWNLSHIPTGVTVTRAYINHAASTETLDSSEYVTVGVHHVYQNYNWTETSIVDDNKPSSTTYYNATSMSDITLNDGDPVFSTSGFNTDYVWNITEAVVTELNAGSKNISLWYFASDTNAFTDKFTFYSKDQILNDFFMTVEYDSSPSDVSIDVNGTDFFSASGTFITENRTGDFSAYLNDYLSTCTPDGLGYCTVPINISSSTPGNVNLSAIEINYTVDTTRFFDKVSWWNQTDTLTPSDTVPILYQFNFISTDTFLNITGYEVDGSVCYVAGIALTVTNNRCDFSSPYYINVSGTDWDNHTIYDGSLGTGSPINQSNGTQSFNGTERQRYINVTSLMPNGSEASSPYTIYNVTAYFTLDDSLLDANHSQGLRYLNGSDWIDLNVSISCNNYGNQTIASEFWQSCANDTDGDGVLDYFQVMIPSMSTRQFQVYGVEDTTEPSLNLTKPTGTYTTNTINIEATVSDDVGVDKCWYNITKSPDTVEKTDTFISCADINTTYTVGGGNGDYTLTFHVNDTSGNLNSSTASFGIDVESVVIVSGGGGGGGDNEVIRYVYVQGNSTNVTYFELQSSFGSKEFRLIVGDDDNRTVRIEAYNLYKEPIQIDLRCIGDICERVNLEQDHLNLSTRQVQGFEVYIDTKNLTRGEWHYFGVEGILTEINGSILSQDSVPYIDTVDVFLNRSPLNFFRVYFNRWRSTYDLFGLKVFRAFFYILMGMVGALLASTYLSGRKTVKGDKNVYIFLSFVSFLLLTPVFEDIISRLIT